MTESTDKTSDYFDLRGVSDFSKEDCSLPPYLLDCLPADRTISICDLGCGFGRLLKGLAAAGFANVEGIDQEDEAVNWCLTNGLSAKLSSIDDFLGRNPAKKYDAAIMSHVLEHIDKPAIIPTLKKIRERLLKPGGRLIIMVPNAQSSTGCYWAYEDFTHSTLFTAGSLSYALKAAGFSELRLVDPDCSAGLPAWKKWIRRALLRIYRARMDFWNKVTGSSFHRPSPAVFSFEIKMVAR